MDLVRHLSYFVAVADEGSFGRAADRLQLTQSPVSKGLRRLEDHLGLELIRRTSSGAELTAAGAALIDRARLLVADAERFRSVAGELSATDATVRLGLAAVLDAELTATASSAVPGAQVTSASTTEVIRQLSAGILDLGVVDHPCVTGTLRTGPVIRFPLTLLVPTAAGTDDIARLPIALPARHTNPVGRDQLLDDLRDRAVTGDPVDVPSADAALAAVAAGRASTVSARSDDANLPGIRAHPLRGGPLLLRVRTVYARPRRASETSADAVEPGDALESALWRLSRSRLRP